MVEEQAVEQEIFEAARKLDSPESRNECLERMCGQDLALRARVEALLHAYQENESFLESPPLEITLDQPFSELPGTSIGPFKLLQQIGEGGMGLVYMAEQSEPIERRVALKIIKPGMDTRQVIARFEAERQALAMMDHQNIAKVFDAGATDAGRPFFVMELVKGVPITEYCDQQKLSPRERLELFVPVCQAVQHAHQKGIIHRDIKPTNVMVAQYDNQPVPKIIDFGVAKAIEQRLTEKTVFTEFGQVVGTVEYMSPEQAQFNQLDIDTRTDIYSLGVLLYELLVGETPFDRERLRSAAFDEVLRIIREEELPRPSLRLSTSESRASIAANRHLDPHKLTMLVHGELDWIVMKALEKERNRRYETANGLAADIGRHLADEPIAACPPSTVYRLKKLARRNKAVMATAAAILLTLFLGIITTSWQAVRATRQRDRAIAAEALAETRLMDEKQARRHATAVNDLLLAALESANPNAANGPDYTVRELLNAIAGKIEDQFRDEPLTEAAIRTSIGGAYQRLGITDEAERHLNRAFQLRVQVHGSQHAEVASTLLQMAWNQLQTQQAKNYEHGEEYIREAWSIHQALGIKNHETLQIISMLQLILHDQGRHTESIDTAQQAISLADELKDVGSEKAMILHRLANTLAFTNPTEGLPIAREAVALHREYHGNLHSETAHGLQILGFTLRQLGQIEKATPVYQEALQISWEVFDYIHPNSLNTLDAVVFTSNVIGDEQALAEVRREVHERAKMLLDRELVVNRFLVAAASAMAIIGDLEGATNYCDQIIQLNHGHPPTEMAEVYLRLSNAFARGDDLANARKHFAKAGGIQGNPVQSLYLSALLDLMLVDREAYRNTCKALLQLEIAEHLAGLKDRIAWATVLGPDALNDYAVPLSYAKAAVERSGNNAGFVGTLGAVHYRAGNFQDAAKQLSESIAISREGSAGSSSVNYYLLFLSMAYWQLGDQEQAHMVLSDALPTVDEEQNSTEAAWNRKATLKLLREEAEALITQKNSETTTNEFEETEINLNE